MNLRYIFKLFLVCIYIFTLPSCNKDNEYEEINTPQTLLFYFVGTDLDTSLNHNFLRNNRKAIKAALNSNIQGNSRVVIFHQDGNNNQGDIIELRYKNGLCQETVLSTVTLPEQMTTFDLGNIFSQMMRFAPANRYSLIIGSHGLGWIPIGAEPNGNEVELGMKETNLQTHFEFWEHKGNIPTRYLGEDTNPQNAFDIPTLSQAITKTGVKMEYILFDACFMANVESAYELRNNTKYIVGSVCEIMGAGFPYINIMPELLKDNGESYDLNAVCRKFNEDYAKNPGYSGSISLIDCSQLDALALKMKQVNNGAQRPFNLDELQFYEGQQRHIFFDLGDYVDAMCDDEALKASFTEQLDRTVVKRYTLDTYYSAYGISGMYPITSYSGLNTSAPATVYVNDYKQTSWYKATH